MTLKVSAATWEAPARTMETRAVEKRIVMFLEIVEGIRSVDSSRKFKKLGRNLLVTPVS